MNEWMNEQHFHRRLPSTEIKSKFTRYYVICSMHDRRKEIVYYCHDCNVALSVDGCFEVYHTKQEYLRKHIKCILSHVDPLLGNESANIISMEIDSWKLTCYRTFLWIWVMNKHFLWYKIEDVFSVYLPWCYITGVVRSDQIRSDQIRIERDQNGGRSDQNGASHSPVRMKWVLGNHLLWVIVIYYDYEWLYKKVLINPITQSKTLHISHAHKHVTTGVRSRIGLIDYWMEDLFYITILQKWKTWPKLRNSWKPREKWWRGR
jgi:hypothetical protein